MILLAEDDEDDQEFLMLAFKNAGTSHSFHIASNGLEVLDYLSHLEEEHLPCLIVLDLNMPVLDGVQTLDALKDNLKYRHIPKVIFTTSDSAADRARCLANGATEYFVKPHNMTEIIKTVETMMLFCA